MKFAAWMLMLSIVMAPAHAQPTKKFEWAGTRFGEARRFELPGPLKYPITAIGKLTHPEMGWCTGFVVDRCTIMTAAHCFVNEDRKRFDGIKFTTHTGRAYSVKNVLYGDVYKDGKGLLAFNDVGFMQIAKDPRTGLHIGEELGGWLSVSPGARASLLENGNAYCTYGFSGNAEGKFGKGTIDPLVKFKGSPLKYNFYDKASAEVVLHAANVSGGASGSPIFECEQVYGTGGKVTDIKIGPGPANVVAMVVAVRPLNPKVNYKNPIDVDHQYPWAMGVSGHALHRWLNKYREKFSCD